MEPVTSVISARQSAILEIAQMKVLVKQREMEKSLIDMFDRPVRAAPPPDQGRIVDKTV